MSDHGQTHRQHSPDTIECKLCGEVFADVKAFGKHFMPGDVCRATHTFSTAGLTRDTHGNWRLK